MSLPREQRLKVSYGQYVDKVREKPLEVRLIHQESNQACMVIPKKYVAKACDRNRVRRICLEYLRKTFKKRKIGAIMVRVYTYPDDLDAVSTVLSKCINQLRC